MQGSVAAQTSSLRPRSSGLSSTSPGYAPWHSPPPTMFWSIYVITHLTVVSLPKHGREIKRGNLCVLFTALASAPITMSGVIATRLAPIEGTK